MTDHHIKPGTYRHFKGGMYEVVGVAHAHDAPDGWEWVIYRGEDGRMWLRLLQGFMEGVVVEGGGVVPRFERVGEP